MKSLSASISLWISLWRTNRFEDLSMDLSILSPSACFFSSIHLSSPPSSFELSSHSPLRPLHHLSFPNPVMCRLVLYSSCPALVSNKSPALVWNKSFRFSPLPFAFGSWISLSVALFWVFVSLSLSLLSSVLQPYMWKSVWFAFPASAPLCMSSGFFLPPPPPLPDMMPIAYIVHSQKWCQ
jgi:hypothetical protein